MTKPGGVLIEVHCKDVQPAPHSFIPTQKKLAFVNLAPIIIAKLHIYYYTSLSMVTLAS